MQHFTLNHTILKVENVSVVYGDKTIIKDVSFEEKDVQRPHYQQSQGQTIAFVGRSGRGKSTLFRVLAGLESPKTGQIWLADHATNHSKPTLKAVKEGEFGFVNQKYTLFRHKTVHQALRFALRNSPLSDGEKEDKIQTMLQQWGLEKVKHHYPNEMSGGQRQRTAILEQLLNSRYFMILDEPFSGLDVGNIEQVKKAFSLISSNHELNTILFSTHDIDLAVSLADSIYIVGHPTLANGQHADYGTLLKQYDLKAMGLAWAEIWTPAHQELAVMIKNDLLCS
ncbi:MAG: ATP-binding cassette domain-containing protein [Sphingobacteriales bacterium]|nr:ATP-binding cassette domain-containing protein [Sphingobacteriales bacterium]